MIGTITEKTEEFLQACKEAGYERVTIFVHDKRVPDSCMIRKSSTGWGADEDGMRENSETGEMEFAPNHKVVNCHGTYWGWGRKDRPFKVVCGDPPQRGPHPTLKTNGLWPKMWGIVKELGLNYAGAGHGEGHDVLCPDVLTAGYYDLAELAEVV